MRMVDAALREMAMASRSIMGKVQHHQHHHHDIPDQCTSMDMPLMHQTRLGTMHCVDSLFMGSCLGLTQSLEEQCNNQMRIPEHITCFTVAIPAAPV